MELSNLLAMFGVSVAAGVTVFAIKRQVESNPIQFQAASVAEAEQESEIYA